MTTTKDLLHALEILGNIFPTMAGENVTGIQFEDGSGKKFNFQINGGNWQFIDLSLFIS